LLEEVVVVGYGKYVKKEDLTGAVSVVFGSKETGESPLIMWIRRSRKGIRGSTSSKFRCHRERILKIRVRGRTQ